jgi:hypothetical protein
MENVFLYNMEWSVVVGIVLVSTVKYAIGVGMAVLSISSPWLGFVFTSLGGILGVSIWVYWGEKLQTLYFDYRNRRGVISKRFSKKNRWLARVRSEGGLPIIALLGPAIISLPVACFIATGMGISRWKVWRAISISVLLWGVIFFGLLIFFDIDLSHYFRHIF